MVNNYITKLDQRILIISVVASVILTQFLNPIASSFFKDFSKQNLIVMGLIIFFYLIGSGLYAIILIKLLFWIFKIRASEKVG